MLKCYYDYFLLNHKIKPCNQFNKELFCEGKSIYEVIRVINGVSLFYDEHIKRLYSSARIIDLDIMTDERSIGKDLHQLIRINNVKNGNAEIIINSSYSRQGCRNNLISLFIENRYPSEEQYKEGMPSIIYKAKRPFPNAKQVLLELREHTVAVIKGHNLYDVILVNEDGFINEGSRSNVFFIKNDTILTPPVHQILQGITRDKIFSICKENNIQIIENEIHEDDINYFDSLFISGTSPKVLPISSIGKVKYDVNNKILRKIMMLYDIMIDDYIARHGKNKLVDN